MLALRDALSPHDATLIVSSTWRETHDIKKLAKLLEPLNKHVQGVTPVIDDPFLKHVRHLEVLQYLQDTNQQDAWWIGIDDTPGFYPADAPVYWTNPSTGFTIDDIAHLHDMISALKTGTPYKQQRS